MDLNETMFDNCANEERPTSIEDCVNQDAVTRNLWYWARKLEICGKILLIFIIFGGIVVSWSNATSEAANMMSSVMEDEGSKFNAGIFFSSILTYAIYAIAEYCLYHVIALLVGSLARIVQSTRTTARLAELEARKNEEYSNISN